MPLNIKKLASTLVRMRDLFVNDPTYAVRSKKFISEFQNYCADELRSRNLETGGRQIAIERSIAVGRGPVEADIGIFEATGEPRLIIDVRSQMTSIGKNFNNYIRMKAGEVESIHAKYPKCVIGLIYIHPVGELRTKRPVGPVGSFNYVNAAAQLASLDGRIRETDSASIFEHVAYCVIDFTAKSPQFSNIAPVQPELMLTDFFDKMSATLRDR